MAKKKAELSPLERLARTRNIGIIAHIDAGKTTTTERILYYTGREHRLGGVDEGTATTDFERQEQERGITITTAAVSCDWAPRGVDRHAITILDTPGHVDFTAEVERSLRVLDGAVGVFCAVGGVEAQSETVWRQADRYCVPRIAFVNKLDRSGADFYKAVQELQEMLGARPAVVQIPYGQDRDFKGIVDLIEERLLVWRDETKGAEFEVHPIPEDIADEVAVHREELIDLLSEEDEALIETVLADEPLEPSEIRRVLRERTLTAEGRITPVLCGSSLRNKGVQPLLDAICDYLPSPLDVPAVVGRAPKRRKKAQADARSVEDWGETERLADPSGPFAALVFKTYGDRHGDLLYMRVYSGQVNTGAMVLNVTQNKKERVGKLYRMYASRKEEPLEGAQAGDIVACVGLRYTRTGDTLSERGEPVLLESISFPDTVMSRAVEPRSAADADALMDAIRRLERDDPTFRASEDKETRQLVLSGMGELHLDVIKRKIEEDFGVKARFREPRVAYRQTLSGPGRGKGRFQQGASGGGTPSSVEVEVEVMRNDFPSAGDRLLCSVNLDPEQLPKLYVPSIEEGLSAAATSSYAWGYPLIQISARVTSVRFDAQGVSAETFHAAASRAFEAAVEVAGVELLEPIMSVEVTTPEEKLGDIVNDLGRRGAEIQEMGTARGTMRLVRGKVPLAAMFGYADEVRSLTSGRGGFSMQPLCYEVVPPGRRPTLF